MHNSIFFFKQISYIRTSCRAPYCLNCIYNIINCKENKKKKKTDTLRNKKRLIAVCELQCNNVYIFWQFTIFETTSSSNENKYYTNKKISNILYVGMFYFFLSFFFESFYTKMRDLFGLKKIYWNNFLIRHCGCIGCLKKINSFL